MKNKTCFPGIFYWNLVDLQCCIVSGVQQNGSDIYMKIYIYIFLRFFSFIDHYEILSIVLSAVQ